MRNVLAFCRDPMKRTLVLLGIASCAAIVALATVFILKTDRFFFRQKGEHLASLAALLAGQIDADEHATIRTPADMDGGAYGMITAALESMQRQTGRVISAYTLRIVDGEPLFIVSPPADYDRDGKIEGELEARDDVGTPYGEPADPAMERAVVRGEIAANPDFTSDRWGTWLTGCAPLRTKAGPIDGAVCVDEDAADVRADMLKVNSMTAGFAVLAVLLMVTTLVGYLRAKLELTGREEAEAGRERLYRRFEAAIENTPSVAVQGFARDGTILLWNRACQNLYGHAREEALGKDICTLLYAEPETSLFRRAIEQLWATRLPLPAREWQAKTASGETRTLLTTIFPVLKDGEVVEAFTMDIDISQEKRAREELQRSLDRMKSFSDMLVGRESRMIELKREINELCDRLGIERRYTI